VTLTKGRLRSWRPAALSEAAADLRATVNAVVAQQRALTTQFGSRLAADWTGGAARAATAQGARRQGSLAAAVDGLGACAIVLGAAAEALTAAQRTMAAAQRVADSAGLVLHDNGSVSIPPALLATPRGDSYLDHLDKAVQLSTALARRALAEATEADADAARDLGRAAELAARARKMGLDIAAAMAATADGAALRALIEAGLVPDIRLQRIPEAARSDPSVAAQWWLTLSANQRALQIRANPELIGGLDGLPIQARDQANRITLAAELSKARADYARMLALGVNSVAAGQRRTYGSAEYGLPLQALKDKIAMLEAVDKQLAGHPERRLMLLDTDVPGRAAIAIGDVDHADHVAVVVPGLNQDVTHDMGRIVGNADRLNKTMLRISAASGDGPTATIAWLGYRTPDFGNVASDNRAETGAEHLRGDLAGLDAWRATTAGSGQGTPVHLTLVGHSYGSLTSGIAMRDAAPVDDLVIIGSPGVGVNNAAALHGVPAGHVYVGEADGDRVADVAHFGTDPNHEAFGARNFRTDAGSNANGEPTHASHGHSQYFNMHTTAVNNMAQIALGHPERVSYPLPDPPGTPASGGGSW